MSTAHCPGPYTNRHFNRSGSIDIDAGAHKLARIYCRELPGGVCTDEAIAEAEATANLLCAAPDLLEALNYLMEQTIDMDQKYGVELSEGEEDARQKALAAIKKASGL